MTDAEKAIREALADPALFDPGASTADTYSACKAFGTACTPENVRAILAHVDAQAAEIAQLTAALSTCVWALRQPLDEWKGECERKALDEARDALKEQR